MTDYYTIKKRKEKTDTQNTTWINFTDFMLAKSQRQKRAYSDSNYIKFKNKQISLW